MKNKIIFLMVFALAIAGLSGCDDDSTAGFTSITAYPVIELEGETFIPLPVGDSYVEPGFTATEAGEDISNSVIVSGEVGTEVGLYNVTYSAKNVDGFSSSVSREILVYDPSIVATDVTGTIVDINTPSRTGEITLVEGTPNIFYCTDFGFSGAFPLYFMMDGDEMTVINQEFDLSATGVDASYDPAVKEFSILIHPYEYSYSFKYQ